MFHQAMILSLTIPAHAFQKVLLKEKLNFLFSHFFGIWPWEFFPARTVAKKSVTICCKGIFH